MSITAFPIQTVVGTASVIGYTAPSPFTATTVQAAINQVIASVYPDLTTGSLELNSTKTNQGVEIGLYITPPSEPTGKPSQGIRIVQQPSGAYSGNNALNWIQVQNDTSTNSSGTSGVATGLSVTYLCGPGDSETKNAALFAVERSGAAVTSSLHQDVGCGMTFVGKSNNGGSLGFEKGGGYGGYCSAHLQNNSTFWEVIQAFQMGIGVETGSSVRLAICCIMGHNNSHAIKGTGIDTCLMFTDDLGSSTGWDTLIESGTALGSGKVPLATTGTFIKTTGAQTFANGVDFSSATISGSAFKSPNFDISGSGLVKGLVTTVASLPSAATAGAGARAIVTNALGPTFGATVAGGGAVVTPVYSDGTNWKVG